MSPSLPKENAAVSLENDRVVVEAKAPPKTSEIPKEKKGNKTRPSWFYSALPFSVASGPLSTYIQLAIITYYGQITGTVYIGLIVTLFNGVTIPASMIWGFATDRIHKRRPIIALSFLLIAGDLLGLLFTKSVFGIGSLYAIFSLLSAASATPYNLLIMETSPKSGWSGAFATFSMISSIGNMLGFVLSGLWVALLPFQWLVVPLSALSLVSAALSVLLVKEPSFVFEREIMVHSHPSFSERLKTLPMIFLKIPTASDFAQIFKGLRFELTSQVPVLYLSIFAFNIAGGIFNTALVPSLTANRLSQSEVYAVILVAMLLQVISFRFAGPYIARRTLVKTATAGLVLRSISYAALGLAAYLVSGPLYIFPALVFYPLAAGIAFSIYYTSSSTMIFNSLGSRNQGSSLGVYSALVGVATMLGSLVSGFTSVYFGYYLTFVLAAFCLAMSAVLTSSLSKFYAPVNAGKSVGAAK